LTGSALRGSLARLADRLAELKRVRRAVILAHNYQLPEVQEVADFVGDSLELARKSMSVDADVIVFAGVSFMAELAKVLNPDKVVLHPNPESRCPLADFLTPQQVTEAKREHPNTPFVIYVNSNINAKALSDYIVTSASAAKLVSRLEGDAVLFGPDRNLADHVATATGKEVIPVPRNGHCPIHEYLVRAEDIVEVRRAFKGAYVLVHPEAPREAREMADYVGSTSQMLRRIGEVSAPHYFLGTEEGLVWRARKLYPGKRVDPLQPRAVCIDMKKISLRRLVWSLETMKHEVRVDAGTLRRVKEILERSLELIK